MAFLNRLFNRKSKAEFLSAPQPSLRRSLTDPNPPSNVTPPRGRRSSSDEKDTVEVLPPSRRGTVRPRRAGCDFGRSKTSIEVGSVRSSSSSAAEPASSSADGNKSRYRQLRALHRTRLHTISAAQDRSSKLTVIIKSFPKARLTSTSRAKLESEVHHLRSLAGVPGVVQLLETFEDDDSAYIVLERCPGPTLIELAANCGGRLSEAALVTDVLIPLALVLGELHRRGIVHRQIKPEHVICNTDSGSITLVDFAEAVNKKQRCLNNRAGSLEYMAPEVLNKPTADEVFHQVLYNGMSEEELPQYDEKADVWSLGVLTFEALTGCQPFLADSALDMARTQRDLLSELDAATGAPRVFAGKPPLSAEARSFVLQALQLDPINRLSAERLLLHPLLQRYWPRFQAKQAAVAGGSGAGGSTTSSVPGTPPTRTSATAIASAAAAAAAVSENLIMSAAGPMSLAAVTPVTVAPRPGGSAAAGVGGCAVPAAAQKAGLLLTAPLQFPVR